MSGTESSLLCWLYEFRQPAATLVAALVAAIIAPLIGLRIYFRQKEYEIVRTRFLENGLDVVAKSGEYALGVFRHNWARGLTALKHFRDTGKDMPEALYTSGYVELEPASYNASLSFILNELFDDKIFHEVQQLLYSFVLNANALIVHDMCTTIRLSIKGTAEVSLSASREEIIEGYFAKFAELDRDSNKFYTFLAAIHELSSALSREKFDFETISEFKGKEVVQQQARTLRALFETKLAEYRKIEP